MILGNTMINAGKRLIRAALEELAIHRGKAISDRYKELARAYAIGKLSFREIQETGLTSYIALLAILADLRLRPYQAPMVGPNVKTRQEGMAQLENILRSK
jgi:hypothetical protein